MVVLKIIAMLHDPIHTILPRSRRIHSSSSMAPHDSRSLRFKPSEPQRPALPLGPASEARCGAAGLFAQRPLVKFGNSKNRLCFSQGFL